MGVGSGAGGDVVLAGAVVALVVAGGVVGVALAGLEAIGAVVAGVVAGGGCVATVAVGLAPGELPGGGVAAVAARPAVKASTAVIIMVRMPAFGLFTMPPPYSRRRPLGRTPQPAGALPASPIDRRRVPPADKELFDGGCRPPLCGPPSWQPPLWGSPSSGLRKPRPPT
ncbi:hypothetical protein [Arthrobacter silviterrae]|uniref:Uncharacterized protein n=1 Tax=Arthrobacter silviterrae TaxID=2026658 RepID=A0ABX0D9V4_9MICC|nr:hypothetical protein [Arthrobacter silviterrae]NGN83468.1 hypothetical protein [Arthrobacter silviterrae]